MPAFIIYLSLILSFISLAFANVKMSGYKFQSAIARRGSNRVMALLFSISRATFGSVGTALLSTMITQREQFHDFRIGERVTIYSLEVQRFINSQVAQFVRQGGDPVLTMKRVNKTLQSSVKLSSFVMAFSECFLVVGS